MWRKFKDFQGLIVFPVILLTFLSLAVIGSISPELQILQLIFFILGFIIFFSLLFVDAKIIQAIAWPSYFFSIIFLLLPFFFPEIRGAHRWISFFSLSIQPAELVKPFLLTFWCYFLKRHSPILKTYLLYLILAFIPSLIVFFQPDLGNSIVYLLVALGLLFISQASLYFFLTLLFFLLGLLPIIWFFLKDYQKLRLVSFLNPQLDTLGTGYNAIQAMIAIGSGQLFGRGLGRGPQSQLRFLPENHTDFIFASLSEELGFFGANLLLFSYFVLLLSLFRLGLRSEHYFTRLFIFAVFFLLLLQITINIGMNLGMLPITGISLPLFSYGGSSLISSLMLLGIINALTSQKKHKTIAIG